MRRASGWLGLLATASVGVATAIGAAPPPYSRFEQLVEANTVAVHAYQVLLARKAGKGDPACYGAGSLSEANLAALVDHQKALLAEDAASVRTWAEGKACGFDPGRDLEPLLRAELPLAEKLPVNVFAQDLTSRAPGRSRAEVRSVANLYQTVLEVERDGDRLQELYAFYIGLGLPVYFGQLGLPGSDADLLATGRELEGRSCDSPVGTSAAEWQIAGRKIWNWGEKNLHIRDDRVLAEELLAEPDVAVLIPRLCALPARKVAVIGHSFTMGLHWSSPSSFVPIVTAMFARENPKVEFRQFQGGGLTSTRAVRNFYEQVIAWKPDSVLLVVLNQTEEDRENFLKMGRGFTAAGATVYAFDNLRVPEAARPGEPTRDVEAAREAGMTVVEVGALIASAPDRERFLCLDRIHMTEPYHLLMAREWLKLLVGARGPKLAS